MTIQYIKKTRDDMVTEMMCQLNFYIWESAANSDIPNEIIEIAKRLVDMKLQAGNEEYYVEEVPEEII